MPQYEIVIKADTSELTALLAELTDIVKRLPKAGLDIPELPTELISADTDSLPTANANEYLVGLKPSDSLLEFAAALRTLDRERLAS